MILHPADDTVIQCVIRLSRISSGGQCVQRPEAIPPVCPRIRLTTCMAMRGGAFDVSKANDSLDVIFTANLFAATNAGSNGPRAAFVTKILPAVGEPMI